MNGKERYLAMLRGEAADAVPRTPILMQFAAEFIGSNYGAFASDHRVLTKANVRCAEAFGMDQLSSISDPYRETQGFGAEVVFETNSVPRCLAPPLADAKDLAKLAAAVPAESERMLDRIKAVEWFKTHHGDDYSILGWIEGPAAEAADLRGVQNFMIDLMDDEAFSIDLMDRCVEVGIAFAEAQINAGADTIGLGDAICSQLPPDLYERLVLPREKRLVQAIQARGAFVKLHICGDITHLLPGIATLAVDLLDVDHMVDMAKTREIVGSGVALTGNIDPVAGVSQGQPDDIRRRMRETYQAVGNPYMTNAGCEIPSGTNPDALNALCDLIPYQR